MKLAAAFLALLFALPATAHEHGEQWTLANESPATSLSGEGDEFFAKQVADLSLGHVSIVTMPDARMGYKAREQLAAVEKGKLVMADTPAAALASSDPVFARPSTPSTAANDARALYEAARPSYEAAFRRHRQKLLYATPGLSFTTVNLVRWKSLDDRERAAVLEAARRTEERVWNAGR